MRGDHLCLEIVVLRTVRGVRTTVLALLDQLILMEIAISKMDVLCISTMTRIQWKIFAVGIVLLDGALL